MVEKFPKSVIEINILVLEADGGVLSAAITAGSLALADAGILCYDLVACSSAVSLYYKVSKLRFRQKLEIKLYSTPSLWRRGHKKD